MTISEPGIAKEPAVVSLKSPDTSRSKNGGRTSFVALHDAQSMTERVAKRRQEVLAQKRQELQQLLEQHDTDVRDLYSSSKHAC